MTDSPEFEGALGLADFLSDLRAELSEAASRAEGEAMKLELTELTVALDVGVTLALKAGVEGKVGAKFWVFGKAEAGVHAEASRQKANTQRLTLKMTPRIEHSWTDQAGKTHTSSAKVDVEGGLNRNEDGA
jgi:hypothetical protein